MFSALVRRTCSIANVITINKYDRSAFLRLYNESKNGTWIKHVRDKKLLNALQGFPKQYIHSTLFRECLHKIHQSIESTIESSPLQTAEHKLIHKMMENSEYYDGALMLPPKVVVDISFEEISRLYNTDWSCVTGPFICDAIKKLSFCYSKGTRFDVSLYDVIFTALINKLHLLTDPEIKLIMQHLIVLENECKYSHSWQSLIKALDTQCINRFYLTKPKEMLMIIDGLYQISASNSNYIWRSLRKLAGKVSALTPKEFVQLCFYLPLYKAHCKVNMFELECSVYENLPELSANEMAIVARTFFLFMRPFTDRNLVFNIITKTTNNVKSLDSWALASIMKQIRYNAFMSFRKETVPLFESVRSEVPRLSLKCLPHISQAFAAMGIYDKILCHEIIDRTIKEIKFARLKDIEKVLLGICMVTPPDKYYTDACNIFLDELLSSYKTYRLVEVSHFPQVLLRIVRILTFKDIHVRELYHHMMSAEFIKKTHRSRPDFIGFDEFELYCTFQIQFPDCKKINLTKNLYSQVMEKLTKGYEDPKLEEYVKFKSEVMFTCKNLLGIDVHVDYILPHSFSTDIVFGLDEHNNSVKVEPILSEMPLGSIKWVNDRKGIQWKVILPIYSYMKIIGHDGYTGDINKKIKQLERIGYTPILFNEMDWRMWSNDEKEKQLRQLIYKGTST